MRSLGRGLALVGFVAAAPALGGEAAEADSLSRLLSENARLALQLELAKSGSFYLLLDLESSRLALMLRGTQLRAWPVGEVEAGWPRLGGSSQEALASWASRAWEGGELDPPRERERQVIEAPPARPGAARESETAAPSPPIPPTAEELYRVPPRYLVRYADGLTLEIDTDTPGNSLLRRAGRFLARAWRDLLALVGLRPRDALRLRLHLAAEDAASLYRSLPPSTKLLVLPPAGRSTSSPARGRTRSTRSATRSAATAPTRAGTGSSSNVSHRSTRT